MDKTLWEKVAIRVTEADHYEKLRWRKAPRSVLEGEARFILLTAGNSTPYPSQVENVSYFMKNYANKPDSFYYEQENVSRSANIGKILANRVKGLSNEEEKVNNQLKIWLNSDSSDFISIHLDKLLTYNAKHQNAVKIPVVSFLKFMNSWDKYKENLISSIVTEYYQSSTNKEK